MLTQARLKELVTYNPDSGEFFRKGKKSGCKMRIGYLCIVLDGTLYYCHRLAFIYMTGALPKGQVDHINGIRDDNRWINLRDVSHNQNCQIKHVASRSSRTGYLGVTADTRSGKFIARYKGKYIGSFDTPAKANQAYMEYRGKLLATVNPTC